MSSLMLMGQVLGFREAVFPANERRGEFKACIVSFLSVTMHPKDGPQWEINNLFMDSGACEPKHIGKVCTVAVTARSGQGYDARLNAADGAVLIETTEAPLVEVNPKFRHPQAGDYGKVPPKSSAA